MKNKDDVSSKGLEALQAIAQAATHSLDLEAILEKTTDEVFKFMGVKNLGLFLYEGITDTLNLKVHRGLDQEFAQKIKNIAMGEGLTGYAAKERKVVTTDSVKGEVRSLKAFRDEGKQESGCYIPLMGKEKLYGVLSIGYHQFHSFSVEEMQFLETIGNLIGQAIENTQLYGEVKRFSSELEKMVEAKIHELLQRDEDLNRAYENLKSTQERLAKANQLSAIAEEAIYTERRRFQALSENAPFGMAVIDKDGAFKYINQKFRELFGYDLNDVPDGKTWFRKAYPDPTYRHLVIKTWVDDLETYAKQHTTRIFTATCKDGTEKIIIFIVVHLETGEYLMVCEDITERKRAEEALRQSEGINRVLFSISNAVNTTVNLDELYGIIHKSLNQIIDVTNFSIALYDHQTQYVTFPYFVYDKTRLPDFTPPQGFTLQKMESSALVGGVLSTGRPLLIKKEEMLRQEREEGKRVFGIMPEVWLGVPLKVKNEVIGVMATQSHTDPNRYNEKDVEIFNSVSDQVALAIDRKRAEEALRQSEGINRVLFSISNAVNTTVNLDELYGIIHKSLNQIIDVTNFSIGLYDHQTQHVTFPYFVSEVTTGGAVVKSRILAPQDIKSSALTGGVLRTGKPLLIKKEEMLQQEKEEGKKVFGNIPEVWLGVPLKIKNGVIGVMATQSHTDPNRYNEKDVEIFNSVSDQVALAIERKRAEEALRQSEEINRTLFSISNAVNTTVNLDELYRSIRQSLGRIIDTTSFFIALYDKEMDSIHIPYFVDAVDDLVTDYFNISSPSSSSHTAIVIKTGKPVLHTDEDFLKYLSERNLKPGMTLSKIWLGVPLKIKNEVIGAIVVHSHTNPNLYDEKDVDILLSVSDQVALAIERKRAEEAQRKSENINRILFSISNAINTTVNLDELYKFIHTSLGQIIDLRNFYISLYDHTTQILTIPYSMDEEDKEVFDSLTLTPQDIESSALTGRVLRTGSPLLIKKEELLQRIQDHGEKVYGTMPEVWLGVPLKTRDKVIGVITTQSYKDPNRYNEKDVEIFNSVSDQVALAIERKRAEEALLNAAQQWRFTFDGISDIVCLLDTEGKILRCNKAMADLLGKPFSEIIDRPHWEIIHGTKAPIQESPVERMRETRRRETAILSIRDRWFNIAVDPLIDEAGGLIGAIYIMSDITERKQAEEALRESEDRYRDLVEYSQYLILTHDLKGQILSVNQEGARLLGYDQWSLLKKNIRDLLVPEVKDEFDAYLDTIRKEGSAKGSMLVHTATGEKRIWEYNNTLRTEGVPVPIVRSIAHDITERLRAEKVVKKLSQENAIMAEIGRIISSTLNIEEVYERFAEEVSKLFPVDRISVSIFNLIDHTYTMPYVFGIELEDRKKGYVAPFKEKFFEEILDKRSSILIQTEDESELAERYPILLSTFRAGLRSMMSIPLISKDQVMGALHFRSTKPNAYAERELRLAERVGNQIAGAIANAQLLTERKQAEEEKEVLQEQLRQSQKMEAIGRLAGGVAHDFNNLLTVIKGYSQFCLVELKKDDPLRENIEEIKAASDRAADLTRQLLAFSRRQVMEMMVLDLNNLVRNLDKMLRRIIGEDIELATRLAHDLGSVKIDPGQIEQVIINLAANARDAMLSGGKITIETTNVELDEAYALSHVAVKPGRYVMLSVSDTGIGMSPEVRERIFEPFFTTKEKGKGTGLGLSMVYGIVKQSGGNIWVYSEPGKGTTFKIYLPRVEEPLEEVRKKVVAEGFPCGNETILVVEDEEKVRKLVVEILSKQGYRVLEALHGNDALLIYEKHDGPIHLILVDVVMPGMSGSELAKRLASLNPKLRVLYMSGYTDNTIVHHGILGKGLNYIQKPFTMDGLVKKVREVLDKNL